jgi:cellulose synthase/poly-beta-1,6-N-acetylglucosamine synthase-like glycosyltransferase
MLLFVLALLALSMTPFTVAVLLTLVRGRKLEISFRRPLQWPRVSIVMPTYNEQHIISEKMSELLNLDYPREKLEIIVVDCSNDETPKILKRFEERYPHIVKVITEQERKGNALASHVGYNSASGGIIVRTDADAKILNKDALKIAVSYLTRIEIGAVTGAYVSSDKTELTYRNILHELQVAESNIDSTVIAHGSFIAFKRHLYEELNPYSPADDTELFIRIRKQGYRTILIPEIKSVERLPSNFLRCISHRARRAHGLIKVIWESGGLLNPFYGVYGLILFLNFYLIAVSPITIFATYLSVAYLLLQMQREALFFLYLVGTLSLLLVWAARDNPIASLLDCQLCGFIGLFKTLIKRKEFLWEKFE